MKPARLFMGGAEIAPVAVCETLTERVVGLLGKDGISGALLIPRCKSVHTIGMRFAIDVIYVRENGIVVDVATMRPWRIGKARRKASFVLEAEAGFAEALGIEPEAAISLV